MTYDPEIGLYDESAGSCDLCAGVALAPDDQVTDSRCSCGRALAVRPAASLAEFWLDSAIWQADQAVALMTNPDYDYPWVECDAANHARWAFRACEQYRDALSDEYRKSAS